MSIQTGDCGCGVQVEREIPDGGLGAIFARTPFVCGPCIAAEEAADAVAEAEFEADRRIRELERRRRASQRPARFERLTVDGLSSDPYVAAVRHWMEDGSGKRGMLLTGPVGVGKTHLAAAVVGTLMEKGREVRWLSGPMMFARLGSGMGTPERDQVISVLTGRTTLVLDDLDKTRPTEYGAENVFLAIDSRVTNEVPLIVTTNLSLGELADRWPQPYGEAIASRLAGYCEIVRMEGHDRRIAA